MKQKQKSNSNTPKSQIGSKSVKSATKSKSVKSVVNAKPKTKTKRPKNRKEQLENLKTNSRKKAQEKRVKESNKAIKTQIVSTSLKSLINNPKSGQKTSKNAVISIPESNVFYKVTGGVPSVRLTQLKPGMYGYSPNSIRASVPKGDLTKEYSRLRSVVQKRIKSFERANIGSTQIKDIKKSMQRIDQLSSNPKTRERQIIKNIVEYNKFLSHETSSVRGYKQDANEWIEKMRYGSVPQYDENGNKIVIRDINQYNYDAVIDALEYLTTAYKGLIYDSDQIIETAIETVNERMQKESDRFFSRYNSQSYRNKIRKEVVEKYESSNVTREEFAKEIRFRNNQLF